MAYQYMMSFSVLAMVILMFLALGLIIWSWGCFLDKYEHDPGRVRATMFLVLVLSTCVDLGLASWGVTFSWVASVSLLVNCWGGLDALLRYPAAHDLESFFCVKQFFLLSLKTLVYVIGIVSFRQHISIFLAVLLVNIWGMPVLYLMALPMDPAEQVIKDDTYDVDLAVRVWYLAVCKAERSLCIQTCRGWWYKRLAAASECSSLARLAICAASPEHRRIFKKMGRSV